MLSVTTPTLENGVIVEYKGIVTGEIVAGINFIKDFGASTRNNALREMEAKAAQIGANAVVGVKIDYESFGNAGMIMVIATGTAVVVQNK